MDQLKEWRFGVVGNITKSHLDEDGQLRYGTKAFTPGTKVFLGGKYWDSSRDVIGVIGQNRFGRMITEAVPVELIENVRTQIIRHPQVLDIIDYEESMEGWDWWQRTAADKKETQQFVNDWVSRK